MKLIRDSVIKSCFDGNVSKYVTLERITALSLVGEHMGYFGVTFLIMLPAVLKPCQQNLLIDKMKVNFLLTY